MYRRQAKRGFARPAGLVQIRHVLGRSKHACKERCRGPRVEDRTHDSAPDVVFGAQVRVSLYNTSSLPMVARECYDTMNPCAGFPISTSAVVRFNVIDHMKHRHGHCSRQVAL